MYFSFYFSLPLIRNVMCLLFKIQHLLIYQSCPNSRISYPKYKFIVPNYKQSINSRFYLIKSNNLIITTVLHNEIHKRCNMMLKCRTFLSTLVNFFKAPTMDCLPNSY
ncbi:hypothetical protein J6895_03863 [Nakaseomyces glabratus]|nr:hypothetical protein J6895_03863 [Nakaseomyces glabratus]